MAPNTIDERLAEAGRRIGQLKARAERIPTAARPRTRRRLEALQHEETTVRAAASANPDGLEPRLGELKARIEIAERAMAADVADGRDQFTAAVESELSGWDTYLERLQTTVATTAQKAREQAETAISELRRRRISVDERLTQAREAAGSNWKEQRERVAAARDELEQKADELSAQLS
jgi:serine phosphatase RsbU (regulator of sigma subunit)